MRRYRIRRHWICFAMLLVLAAAVLPALGQDGDNNDAQGDAGGSSKSLLDFIRAGRVVGFVIIGLSLAGVALVIEGFLNVKTDKMLPPTVIHQANELARKGRFSEVLTLCQANDSVLSRILRDALAQGQLGIDAVREAMQDSGTREVTRLRQRVGYVGFIASVAPMLGLLGPVTGLISSFNVLGMEKGAARPDQLAVGISEALVTTCMGLTVAIPLMFCHNILRDRVTRIGQAASAQCERLLRVMTVVVGARAGAHPASEPKE